MHALHYANELLVCVRLFFSKTFANSLILICRNNSKNAWEKSNDAYSLLIRVHTTKNHISICFYHTISTSKKIFFFRARAEKGIAWHIDESSVVWTLIYHGKLANQIARLAAIVVKNSIAHGQIPWVAGQITAFLLVTWQSIEGLANLWQVQTITSGRTCICIQSRTLWSKAAQTVESTPPLTNTWNEFQLC